MAHLSIQLLGSFRVALNGEPVTAFESDKVRALLAYLAVEADRPHRREKLVGLLWPDWPERSARASLSQALYNLRAVIEDRAADSPFLLITLQTLQFHRESNYVLDVALLTGLREGASQAGLEEALAAYRGSFLAGFSLPDSSPFEEWVTEMREHLGRLALETAQRLVVHHGARAEYPQALKYARRGIELEPTWEWGHRAVMRTLALGGDRNAALAHYEICRRIVAQELGVEPAEETRALYQRIQTEELAPAPGRPAEIEVQLPDWLVQEREPLPLPVFVGRERQLAQLEGFLARAIEGRGQVAFITGGPGRGKTALMDEFSRRAVMAHDDLLVAAGACSAHSGAGDPYLPFRELLGTLGGDVRGRWVSGAMSREGSSRLWRALPRTAGALLDHGRDLIDVLVPGRPLLDRVRSAVPDTELVHNVRELVEAGRRSPGELGQRQLFGQLGDVLRALAADHPLLILLDDLQWADSSSAELLFHLGRRLEGARTLIVGAYRPEEVALGRHGERHPLEKVLAELKRQYGEVWLDLAEAQELEGRGFIDAFLNSEPNRLGEGFRGTLFRHTAGHPLFTVELLRAMQERGDLMPDAEGRWVEGPALDWQTLPARVEGVIEERIGRLEAELREILTIASVEGEDFTTQAVARVGQLQERQLLRQLSRELERRHRLVREQGEAHVGGGLLSRYRFAHALFQRYLYNELSAAERRLLHREMGSVLEALYGEDANAIASQLARHYDEGGMPGKAIHYLLQAGDRARLAYAHQEAIHAYRRALALLKEDGDYEIAARTAMNLGITYHAVFGFREARQAFDEGFALERLVGLREPRGPAAPLHTLTGVWTDNPRTLDPAFAEDEDAALVIRSLFSGLLVSSEARETVPDAARSWDILDGGQRYIFHLRDDVRWSDGTRVTAADFEFAWKRILDPATASPLASLLYDIKGGEAYHKGQGSRADVGVEALDETTFSVELEGPTGYFLNVLMHVGTFPVPRHVVERHGEGWTEVGRIVTNGPFTLESWQWRESLTLTRNPAYHGRSGGNVGRVEMVFREDRSAHWLNVYQAGGLGILLLVEDLADSARQAHPDEYAQSRDYTTWSILFHVHRPPFSDWRVRRAFVHATDRDTAMEIWSGLPATGGFLPPDMPGHCPGISLPYDPAEARRLLCEAGYAGGQNFPRVEALTHLGAARMLHHALSEQWRENLGVVVEWKGVEWTQYQDRLGQDPPHLWWWGWAADYPDPDSFMRTGILDAGPGRAAWQDNRYEELIERARRILDRSERIELYRQAEGILVQEAPLMPCFYRRRHWLIKPWVRDGLGPWKDVIIEPH
jgi:ABC-type oligopeptide transport system substrate-binding subunit/DNA-binding SARP family transcriptional activator